GIIGFAQCHEARPVSGGGGDLVFGFRLGGDAQGAPRRAGKARQCVKRRLGSAEAVEQLSEGDGADIIGADETQPGKALGGGETGVVTSRQDQAAFLEPPMVGSVPARSRAMFSRCWKKSNRARAMTVSASNGEPKR